MGINPLLDHPNSTPPEPLEPHKFAAPPKEGVILIPPGAVEAKTVEIASGAPLNVGQTDFRTELPATAVALLRQPNDENEKTKISLSKLVSGAIRRLKAGFASVRAGFKNWVINIRSTQESQAVEVLPSSERKLSVSEAGLKLNHFLRAHAGRTRTLNPFLRPEDLAQKATLQALVKAYRDVLAAFENEWDAPVDAEGLEHRVAILERHLEEALLYAELNMEKEIQQPFMEIGVKLLALRQKLQLEIDQKLGFSNASAEGLKPLSEEVADLAGKYGYNELAPHVLEKLRAHFPNFIQANVASRKQKALAPLVEIRDALIADPKQVLGRYSQIFTFLEKQNPVLDEYFLFVRDLKALEDAMNNREKPISAEEYYKQYKNLHDKFIADTAEKKLNVDDATVLVKFKQIFTKPLDQLAPEEVFAQREKIMSELANCYEELLTHQFAWPDAVNQQIMVKLNRNTDALSTLHGYLQVSP